MKEEDKSKDMLSPRTVSKDLRNRKIKLEIIARENIIKMRKEKEELK